MRRNINPLWVALLFASLSATFNFAATITWINTAGGDWNVAANWSPNQVPTNTDTALITNNGTYSVTNNGTASVNVLTLGGTTGTQTLVLSSGSFSLGSASTGNAQAVFDLSGGAFGGAGPLVLAGPMNWSGGTIFTNQVQFNGGTFSASLGLAGGEVINTGTLTWTAASTATGLGSIISNSPAGIINLTANLSEGSFGGARIFNNAGQLNVAVSSTASIGSTFTNTGSVAVNGGTLEFIGGGTSSGSIAVASGSTLDFGSGTFSIDSGTLSGAGKFMVDAGTVTVGVALNLGGTWTFNGGTTTLSGSTTVSGNAVTISGGTVIFNGTGPWQPGTLTFSSGALGGATPVTVQNLNGMAWSGGTIYTNQVQFNGGTFSNSSLGLAGGEAINTGTLTWTATSIATGLGSIISNAPSGIINLSVNPNGGSFGGTRSYDNAGQLNVSVSGTASIGDSFTNTGSVAINGGTLDFIGGGTSSGSIAVASGTTLDFGSGTFSINSGTLSGAGNFMVDAGTVTVGVALNLGGTWTFNGGTTTLSGSTTVSGNAVIISGGSIVVFNGTGPWKPGTLTLNGALAGATPVTVQNVNGMAWGGGSIITNRVQFNGGSFSNNFTLNGGEVINTGTLNWTAAGIAEGLGSIISNAPTGIINMSANPTGGSLGGARAFYNAGQLNVALPGTANIADAFTNTGVVTINGGTLDLSGAHSLAGGNLVFGINALNNYGSNSLANAANLAGTLKSVFNGGYLPSVGNTYNIMTYGSSSGNFTTTNLSPLATWQVNQAGTALSITVVKLVPQVSVPPEVIFGNSTIGSTLNATATWNGTNVPGVFSYTPAAGTVLNIGPNQPLSVIFVPTDPSTFVSVTNNFLISVIAPPSLTITANSNQYTLTFAAISSEIYQLQIATNLATPAWASLGSVISNTIGTVNVTNTISDTQAFFRLKIQPVP